ncbi:unnamed protein product [Didymodactylos carnosus]|uniref:Enoyl reductase (ER) domain-containing protein n=1 Tax=Didymodactylos carnosus TaxID=1234261 RepID=A0A813UCI4_9BILA|nr:unnamed protein product [Didymodactylos carnosus]CAF0825751.1 unnamed protein product [Didymodactylos carnosus]CAF3544191.1 unnamed protein product [Didymodactylos carnosus]CAF3612505.1 unnamed protein product [Didymodactylos carnosus]
MKMYNKMIQAQGLAVIEPSSQFQLFPFYRHAPGPHDVLIRIHYCGICRSDISSVKNEWKNSHYPLVPGHEITGVIEKRGDKVSRKLRIGDKVGIGCLINSCRHCDLCKDDLEHLCSKSVTYNQDTIMPMVQGGYSTCITVDEHYVVKIGKDMPLDASAPLLCTGISVYSALKQHRIGKNTKIAIAGHGSLAHIAIQMARVFGADVTVILAEEHIGDAMNLGAKHYLCTSDKQNIKRASNKFHFILDTISNNHDIVPYLELLKFEGTLCMIGMRPTFVQFPVTYLLLKRLRICGSMSGGMKELQKMFDFCSKHSIQCDFESVPASSEDILAAYERVLKDDAKCNYVIDLTKGIA